MRAKLKRLNGLKELFLVLGLCSSLSAQEPDIHKVSIRTQPESVEAYLDVSGRRRYEKFLGRTNQPILLDLRELQGASGYTIVLRRQGYFDKRERLSMDYFQGKDFYPEAGRIRLEPESWTVPVVDFASNWWPVVLPLGFAGTALVVVALRRRRKTLERVRKLEKMSRDTVDGDPYLNTVLNGWRLSKILGRGASATVYLAIPDDSLDESQAVAIKLFTEEGRHAQEFLSRFQREAQLYQALNHKGIVQLLDWGQDGNLSYLIMEYVEGEPLRGRRVTGPEGEKRVLGILLQLVAALNHAHDANIIHRDVKPGNVLLTKDGTAKLLDFGLAREVLSSFTKTGQALGTPLYMSPEQITGTLVDHRCDQYSLGSLAYELLTGTRTFGTGESKVAPILFQQVNQDPDAMSERGATVSPETSAIVERLLQRDATNRYANLKEVERALRASLEKLQKN